jgi:lysylphosphatidylglycerol synthetase-like protein (DUF2156 family)
MQFIHIFAAGCDTSNFFSIPPWYKYLVLSGRMVFDATTGACELVGDFQWQNGGDISLIALALVDILLHVAGLVAVGFIVYGGIQYVSSDGAPDKTKAAQETIINALIGLIIALIASAAISFFGRAITR